MQNSMRELIDTKLINKLVGQIKGGDFNKAIKLIPLIKNLNIESSSKETALRAITKNKPSTTLNYYVKFRANQALYLKKHRNGISLSDDQLNENQVLRMLEQRERIIRKLVKEGADIDYAPKNKETALQVAINNSDLNAIDLLLELGANLSKTNETNETPIYLAIKTQDSALVTHLIKHEIDINNQTTKGETPLMIASHYGDVEIVKAILNKNPDINIADNMGDTALNWTCYSQKYDIAHLLLDNKANPFIKNKEGKNTKQIITENPTNNANQLIERINFLENTEINRSISNKSRKLKNRNKIKL